MQIMAVVTPKNLMELDSGFANKCAAVVEEIVERVSAVAEPIISQASQISVSSVFAVIGTGMFGWAAGFALKRTAKALSQCDGRTVIEQAAKTVVLTACAVMCLSAV